jgi:hypothetical protein
LWQKKFILMGAVTRWRMMLTCSRAFATGSIAQGSEPSPPSPLRHRDDKIRIHRARHRRLHDGKLGLDEVQEAAIRPHGLIFQLRGRARYPAADHPGPAKRPSTLGHPGIASNSIVENTSISIVKRARGHGRGFA